MDKERERKRGRETRERDGKIDIARNEIERGRGKERNIEWSHEFFFSFIYRNGDDRESLTGKIDIHPASLDRLDREVARGDTKDARSEYRVTAPARYALSESEGDGAKKRAAWFGTVVR